MTVDSEKGKYPTLIRVRQRFEEKCVDIGDIPCIIASELNRLAMKDQIQGKRIAITAGSRGISNIPIILKSIVDYVKDQGGFPFIVPAMGSHGGATAEGQRMVLEQYGIQEESMGCPIRSSMEVVYLGETENGAPVYFDRNAYESDGIIVCNRVKPHTDFSGVHESGIVKMVAIGLGKERGCSAMHSRGLAETIPLSCRVSMQKAPIMCGLAIVENSSDQTYILRGISREDYFEQDAALLKIAKKLVPHLPAEKLDILIVKEIGKIYSGTGMDTKVIGRIHVRGVEEPEVPDIRTIVALRLNEHSYGNAYGIGLADITTTKLVERIDRKALYSNLIPTTYFDRGKIPIYFDTEREAIEKAYYKTGTHFPTKIAVIENTLRLESLLVSEEVLQEHPELEVIERDIPLTFDEAGNLLA